MTGVFLYSMIGLRPGSAEIGVYLPWSINTFMLHYCRANISRQKVPKYIRFVTGFPLTASGKVKKFELREQLIKELGLEDVARLKTA